GDWPRPARRQVGPATQDVEFRGCVAMRQERRESQIANLALRRIEGGHEDGRGRLILGVREHVESCRQTGHLGLSAKTYYIRWGPYVLLTAKLAAVMTTLTARRLVTPPKHRRSTAVQRRQAAIELRLDFAVRGR